MFEWEEYKWIIIIAIAGILLILLDEVAYQGWRKANPGAMYSHLRDKTITPIDATRPPMVYYE